MHASPSAQTAQPSRRRIVLLDTLRGLLLVSMIAFHATYDAAYIYGYDVSWFLVPLIQDVWRASISWSFLFLAGWMTSFSHNNLRRAGLYGAAALLVWLATTVAALDTPINFGILFCMFSCTLVWAAAQRILIRIPSALGIVVCLALFAALWDVPHQTYGIPGLAWLGLPDAGFSSGDYYPIIPFVFMYLSGAFASRRYNARHRGEYPDLAYRNLVPPLTWLGQRSLVVYLAHQVLIVLVFEVLAVL